MLDRRALALTVLCFTFSAAAEGPPTVAEAEAFMTSAERRLLQLSVEAGRADWVKLNFITEDTELLAAKADERAINTAVELAKQSVRFDKLSLPEALARKMRLLKNGLTLATPSDPKESEQLTRIASSMEGLYGKGKYCRPGMDGKEECRDLGDLSKVLAASRNYDELLDAWTGWHAISRPMRKDFMTYVALANKGARELGFADTGAMWRSKYDMPPDAFASELDRLWEQVKPLYLSLHAYVRTKLREKYGNRVPANGPIPAHLLGNMWAQEWGNIYPLVAPAGADPGYDLTQILKSRKTNDQQMVRYGEGFFTSLGFAPLPETFWKRSLFLKPRDRLQEQGSFPERLGQRREAEGREEALAVPHHLLVVRLAALEDLRQVVSRIGTGRRHERVDVSPLLRPHVAEEMGGDRPVGRNAVAVFLAQLRPHVGVEREVERLHLLPQAVQL